jgi:hypothetical protein
VKKIQNAELRDRWLAALRSGEYEQGQNRLKYRDHDGVVRHCCLGVLCDVADPRYWEEETHFGRFSYKGHYAFTPPEDIYISVGLDSKYVTALTDLNDSYFETFEEIADFVERFAREDDANVALKRRELKKEWENGIND